MRDHRARCDGAHPATPSRRVTIYQPRIVNVNPKEAVAGFGPKAQVMFILGQRAKARGGLEGVTSCQSVACDTNICSLRLR
jgi:hypothetical protein